MRMRKRILFGCSYLFFSFNQPAFGVDHKPDRLSLSKQERASRISLFGGYHLVQGPLKDVVREGFEGRLAYDAGLSSFWREMAGSYLPYLRLEFGYAGFGGLPGTAQHSITGPVAGLGPLWLLPWMSGRSALAFGTVAGFAWARLQSPAVDIQTTLFTLTAFSGYEHAVAGVRLFVYVRAHYLADQNNPLLSVGGVFGIMRELRD